MRLEDGAAEAWGGLLLLIMAIIILILWIFTWLAIAKATWIHSTVKISWLERMEECNKQGWEYTLFSREEAKWDICGIPEREIFNTITIN